VSNTAHIVQFTLCGLWSRTIQSIYSSVYLCFNIQLKVAPLLLEVSRQFNARYTAYMVPNTAHILQFMLGDLWSRPYTKYLLLRIFRPQYSAEGSTPAIGGISKIQCALYCKFCVKYSAHRPVYSVLTVVPDVSKVLTAPHNYASIFSCRHLSCYWRYHIISMRVILQTWCQIQRISTRLRYMNCCPGHIQSIYCSAYLGFNMQL
jgi:hypothetical protein